MSVYRFRERWSIPGRRAAPSDVGARMAAWLLDAVGALGPDLAWETVDDKARNEDSLVHRRLALEGTITGALRARAHSELALSRGERPSGSGRIELVRAAPFARVVVDTHGGEEHWDVDACGLSEPAMASLRDAHARAMDTAIVRGGARRDPPIALPFSIAGDAADVGNWLSDLEALDCVAHVGAGELVIESLALPDLTAVFEARVALGEILSEAGEEDWDERAVEILFALSTAP